MEVIRGIGDREISRNIGSEACRRRRPTVISCARGTNGRLCCRLWMFILSCREWRGGRLACKVVGGIFVFFDCGHWSVDHHLCEPRVREDGLNARALGGILLKYGCDKVLCLLREAVGDLKVALKDLLLHDSLVVVVKGQCSTEKCVENDTERPNVDLFACILFAGEHLWGGIAGGAAESVHKAVALKLAGEAKVAKLDVAALVEKDVFELEVAVNDALAVDISDGEAELTKDPARLWLGEGLVFDQVIVEFAAGTELADHPDVLLCCNDFVELHDIGMM